MTIGKLFCVSLLISSASLVGGALAATSPEVSAACRADAMKFCMSVIRDDAKRADCMHEHAAELSKACVDAVRKDREANPSGTNSSG